MRNHTLRKLNMEFFPVHGIIIAINISSVTGKKKRKCAQQSNSSTYKTEKLLEI